MSECSCEAVLLGREPVKGTANADSLAGQIRLVTAPGRPGTLGRKCRLRCSRDGIEIRPAKRQEDEGFESDDDAVSQTSSDSNSSSYCFVEDHVLKFSGAQSAGVAEPSVATDSANSSGASDNDDADNSLNPGRLPSPSPPQPSGVRIKPRKSLPDDSLSSREVYAFSNVAFCHTDAGYPKVLVLVIRKKSQSSKEDVQSLTGLEAVIFQCKSVQNVREVCASYKEFSRRLKMDLQFRYPHKRKDFTSSSVTLYRNVFDVLQKSMSNASSPANSTFFKTSVHHVADKTPSIVKEDFPTADANKKYNLVQRTDEDGVTHIEVSKAVAGDYFDGVTTSDEYSGSSSIISISTPDVGNLFMSSSTVVHSPSPSFTETSSSSGEIDGVICTDIESSSESNTKTLNNIVSNQSIESNEKDENTIATQATQDTPPKRPQRGKYIKNNAKAKQPIKSEENSKVSVETDVVPTRSTASEHVKQTGTQEKVVRGQFIRVNVEQQQQQSPSQFSTIPRPGHRLFSESRPSGQMLSYPAWNLPSPATSGPSKRGRRAREDETDYRSRGEASKSYQRRSRSSGGVPGRRATSPPARPLMYRYIDSFHPKPLSNKVFGKLKEIANINNSCVGTLSRRRNSSDHLSTVQFYTYLEPSLKVNSVSKSTTNLKSVIKKKNCNENLEPKKVTFSAYATVQVVD